MRRVVALAFLLAAPALARTSLGTFDKWGAFRDDNPPRCYAIALPISGGGGKWRSFVSVANWPKSGVRGQIHIRLAKQAQPGAPATLSINGRTFPLIASGADAWAPDARVDAGIVATMRSASEFSVSARANTGGAFTERYSLKGAATAIDAATFACARG